MFDKSRYSFNPVILTITVDPVNRLILARIT